MGEGVPFVGYENSVSQVTWLPSILSLSVTSLWIKYIFSDHWFWPLICRYNICHIQAEVLYASVWFSTTPCLLSFILKSTSSLEHPAPSPKSQQEWYLKWLDSHPPDPRAVSEKYMCIVINHYQFGFFLKKCNIIIALTDQHKLKWSS